MTTTLMPPPLSESDDFHQAFSSPFKPEEFNEEDPELADFAKNSPSRHSKLRNNNNNNNDNNNHNNHNISDKFKLKISEKDKDWQEMEDLLNDPLLDEEEEIEEKKGKGKGKGMGKSKGKEKEKVEEEEEEEEEEDKGQILHFPKKEKNPRQEHKQLLANIDNTAKEVENLQQLEKINKLAVEVERMVAGIEEKAERERRLGGFKSLMPKMVLLVMLYLISLGLCGVLLWTVWD